MAIETHTQDDVLDVINELLCKYPKHLVKAMDGDVVGEAGTFKVTRFKSGLCLINHKHTYTVYLYEGQWRIIQDSKDESNCLMVCLDEDGLLHIVANALN